MKDDANDRSTSPLARDDGGFLCGFGRMRAGTGGPADRPGPFLHRNLAGSRAAADVDHRCCVAGTTSYTRSAEPNQLRVRDACRKGGEEIVLRGEAEILDPGVNSRLIVRYNPLLSVEYDIVDHASDYSWFIETSPTLDNVFIFTRSRPSKRQLEALVERVRRLGYDTSNLEFPWKD